MKMRTAIFVALLMLLHFAVQAQSYNDFAGEWVGYITQDPAGLAARYDFALSMEVSDSGITGEARISLEDNADIYGTMYIRGGFGQYFATVNELEITSQNMCSYAYWCMKEYDIWITEQNGILIIEGKWNSDQCGDANFGKIHLERRLS